MKTLIKNGLLIDGTGSEPVKDHIVVVEDQKITYAGAASAYSSDGSETVIDAQGGTIVPGFIDTHVHMMMEYASVAERLETPFSYSTTRQLNT